MKTLPCCLLVISLSLSLLLGPGLRATDFNLQARKAGPGHRQPSEWWRFNKETWELATPEKYVLSGGAAITLQTTDNAVPGVITAARPATGEDLKLLAGRDMKAQADYVRSLLPSGILNATMFSQAIDPMKVNNLTNFQVVYDYELGGQKTRLTYMVSQATNDKGQPEGDAFTTVVSGAAANQPEFFRAFMQLMATARVTHGEPGSDANDQYASHNMMGR